MLGSLGIFRLSWTVWIIWLTHCVSSRHHLSSIGIPLRIGHDGLETVSIFNLPLQSNTANYTVALTIPNGSTDLYFHLSGPTAYSWISVGTRSEMADSMVFVMYPNVDGSSELVHSCI